MPAKKSRIYGQAHPTRVYGSGGTFYSKKARVRRGLQKVKSYITLERFPELRAQVHHLAGVQSKVRAARKPIRKVKSTPVTIDWGLRP